jgi:hypothetical protein
MQKIMVRWGWFTPRFEQNRTVYLINLQGEVVRLRLTLSSAGTKLPLVRSWGRIICRTPAPG